MRRPLRERLEAGELVTGTWCLLPSPEVADVIAAAGLDFIIVDLEHGQADLVTAGRMVMASRARGCSSMIRVASNDQVQIARALDLDPDGVIAPHVESVAERNRFVGHSKYPPHGWRGYSPYTRAGGFSYSKDYTERANRDLVNAIIIESPAGLDDIEKIASDPGVDVVYLGAYDLSVSMGIPGQIKHPRLVERLEDAARRIVSAGKCVGAMYNRAEDRKALVDMGVTFLVYRVDSSVLFDGYVSAQGLQES